MLYTKCSFRMTAVWVLFSLILVWPVALEAGTFKVLHRFKGSDGAHPFAGLTFDAAGNLYGTSFSGGACSASGGCGTVFKLEPNSNGSWTETVLYSFCSLPKCADGKMPWSSLVFDAAGNLYGTTAEGGDLNCDAPFGCGVVFELASNPNGTWTETILHTFTGADGIAPSAGLIFDAAGNLYGTTSAGGGGTGCEGSSPPGCGTVFKLTQVSAGQWTETLLYRFTGGSDGAIPKDSLIFDADGNLYGTTIYGGNIDCFSPNGCGVAFKLTANTNGTWTQTVLHTFTGGADGKMPVSGLVLDSAGNLYGTASAGGAFGYGLAFVLKPDANGTWSEHAIHDFANRPGANPWADLVFDAAGKIYGTTASGSETDGGGVVFKMTPRHDGTWDYSRLHLFAGKPALRPYNRVVRDIAGNLYGTALDCASGQHCQGVVYEIIP